MLSRRLLSPLIMLSMLGAVACGQDVKNQAKGKLVETKEAGVFKIEFPGGTLNEYVNLVRQIPIVNNDETQSDYNVVVADSAKNIKMPTIEVTTDISGAVGIIEKLLSGNQVVSVERDPSGEVDIISAYYDERPHVTVASAKMLLSKLERETLLSSIEIGLEMLESDPGVTMKLHQETGLLFIKGPRRATELVKDVLKELEHDVLSVMTKQRSFESDRSGGAPDNKAGGASPDSD